MIKKITGGIASADELNMDLHASALVFKTSHDNTAYNGALVPSDDDAKVFLRTLPQYKDFEILIEVKVSGRIRPLQFKGNAKFQKMEEPREHIFFILSTTNWGVFRLIFDYQSTKNLKEKFGGVAVFVERPFELALEF